MFPSRFAVYLYPFNRQSGTKQTISHMLSVFMHNQVHNCKYIWFFSCFSADFLNNYSYLLLTTVFCRGILATFSEMISIEEVNPMKKIIALIAALVMVLSFTAALADDTIIVATNPE